MRHLIQGMRVSNEEADEKEHLGDFYEYDYHAGDDHGDIIGEDIGAEGEVISDGFSVTAEDADEL